MISSALCRMSPESAWSTSPPSIWSPTSPGSACAKAHKARRDEPVCGFPGRGGRIGESVGGGTPGDQHCMHSRHEPGHVGVCDGQDRSHDCPGAKSEEGSRKTQQL